MSVSRIDHLLARVSPSARWTRACTLALLMMALVLSAACAETSSSTQYAEPAPAESTSAPVATAPAVTAPGTPKAAIKATAVTVTRIVDGDTIHVRMPNGTIEKIRFIGVDTPESTNQIEPYGAQATAYTANALSGKTIYLETDAELRDRYGRMLAHVWLSMPDTVHDGSVRAQLFNAKLLLDGYANLMTVPPNVKYVDYLRNYEGEARAASKGLWAAAPAAQAPTPPVSAVAPTTQASGSYIANKNTGKFHHAYCSSVDDMNESNKVPYSSRDKAASDGYIPCKRCNP
ncbi:MAG: thermonuclease family protein [Coriobacteriia bacterium]